jgi:hypothetical protein
MPAGDIQRQARIMKTTGTVAMIEIVRPATNRKNVTILFCKPNQARSIHVQRFLEVPQRLLSHDKSADASRTRSEQVGCGRTGPAFHKCRVDP